jgi:hypothetical protein
MEDYDINLISLKDSLDKTVDEYIRNRKNEENSILLKKISKDYGLDYKELVDKYIGEKIKKKKSKKDLVEDKKLCMAKVKNGNSRCSRQSLEGNDYCKTHLALFKSGKLLFGSVDDCEKNDNKVIDDVGDKYLGYDTPQFVVEEKIVNGISYFIDKDNNVINKDNLEKIGIYHNKSIYKDVIVNGKPYYKDEKGKFYTMDFKKVKKSKIV